MNCVAINLSCRRLTLPASIGALKRGIDLRRNQIAVQAGLAVGIAHRFRGTVRPQGIHIQISDDNALTFVTLY